ncbi:hypothetical protein WH47_06334 [Habropoda laboriosa]|uniref:Uncharacterized protein n=1 Tax=Habropoda laboriosa TaxID=597456 RepID=A0A0L7RCH9_9HYME|nr:PREDICTED: uncharacterized protein LOC108579456 [Habropoda laboriosa]KOC68543.1 hypothetical protein WH47_06334 [Habropoda laboriosa]
MSKVSGMLETEDVVGKSTLSGRVSDKLKDGSYSGPPMLFRHESMQKIRHCCQNLNLLPYLLYSFDNSKSHPIVRKVHLCLGQFLEGLTVRFFFLYSSIRQSLLRDIRSEESQEEKPAKTSTLMFREFGKQKPKQNPLHLILAVYFVLLLLTIQMVGLFSLMVFGKYTPGFIFLVSSLMFLAYISLKVLFHESANAKCRSKKTKAQ